MPGNLTLPTPNAYRSPFRHADGSYDWRSELEYGFAIVDVLSSGSLAACLIEPILSSGGIIEPPRGYLARLKELCVERGMLLIVDEAQTGIGRTGTMYAHRARRRRPGPGDAVEDPRCGSAGGRRGRPVKRSRTVCHERGFLFFTTHVSDPLAAAVALTVLTVVERDGLVDQGRGSRPTARGTAYRNA